MFYRFPGITCLEFDKSQDKSYFLINSNISKDFNLMKRQIKTRVSLIWAIAQLSRNFKVLSISGKNTP